MSSVSTRLPQYRRLYEMLRKHILAGVYIEGDLLPSEHDLCETYRMMRPTVRHALDDLVKDGFVIKRKGKGTIVRKKNKGIGILSVSGTTMALEGVDLKTRIIVIPVVKKWPEPFMFPLEDHEKESGCIYMERLRLVDGIPLFYDLTFIPNINLPRFTSRKFTNKSLFDTLRAGYNLHVTGGEQRLKAIGAEGKIKEYLKLPPGHPVLYLERKMDTNRHSFSFYSSVYCNTRDHDLFGTF